MSLPPCPGRGAPSRHPRGRAVRMAAAALGTLLALAAWLISEAGVAQAASPWPSGHGAQVREAAWIPAPASGTLRPGMQGAAVRRLQQRLAQLHYYPGAVNGLQVPLGRMYNPVFFIGANFAIHGDIPIPLQPASHGCVRIPVDVANLLYRQIRISPDRGTPIYVRGQAPGTLIRKPRPGRRAHAGTATPAAPAPATPTPRVTGNPALIKIPGVPGLVSPR